MLNFLHVYSETSKLPSLCILQRLVDVLIKNAICESQKKLRYLHSILKGWNYLSVFDNRRSIFGFRFLLFRDETVKCQQPIANC